MACPSPPLDLPLHPDIGLLAQRRRRIFCHVILFEHTYALPAEPAGKPEHFANDVLASARLNRLGKGPPTSSGGKVLL